LVPSANGTSSTHSGRRVVIERAIAERLPSGAITARLTPSSPTSARRIACSPSASIPSSLVRSTFSIRLPSIGGGSVVGREDMPLPMVGTRGRGACLRLAVTALFAGLLGAVPASAAGAVSRADREATFAYLHA